MKKKAGHEDIKGISGGESRGGYRNRPKEILWSIN